MGKKKIVNFLIAQEFLKRVGGDFAVDIVRICERKKAGATDEVIGREIKKLKVTEIRTILNKLHYRGIADYQKTRDNKTGWYTYTWIVTPKRVTELILDERIEEIQKLEKKLDFHGVGYKFFSCTKTCTQLPFEVAAEYNFKCPECNQTMNLVDIKKQTRDLREKIKTMKSEVCELQALLR